MRTGKQETAEEHAGEAQICIIDGDQGVRESIGVLLGTLGVSVIGFPSPEAFLDWLKKDQPSLLITELIFSGMNGFELKETLDLQGFQFPVIGITGELTTVRRKRATRSGFLDLIEKPFMSELILSRTREALGISPRIGIRNPHQA